MSITANTIENTNRRPRAPRNYGAIAGLSIAGAAVAGGFFLERGAIGGQSGLNAGLLVVGGTAAAILIGTPLSILGSAMRRASGLFRRESNAGRDAADSIMRCAVLSRRQGAASIEQIADTVGDGVLRHALLLVVDGVAPEEIRRQLQIEIAAAEDRAEADARVFEQAGGYAPTIGIIGAVIGLIQVMRHLGNVDEVGRGIAAAFMATLFGVALANLLLLPLAARIRSQARSEIGVKELILEGVTALGDGLTLRLIRTRLETFLNPRDTVSATGAISAQLSRKAAGKSA